MVIKIPLPKVVHKAVPNVPALCAAICAAYCVLRHASSVPSVAFILTMGSCLQLSLIPTMMIGTLLVTLILHAHTHIGCVTPCLSCHYIVTHDITFRYICADHSPVSVGAFRCILTHTVHIPCLCDTCIDLDMHCTLMRCGWCISVYHPQSPSDNFRHYPACHGTHPDVMPTHSHVASLRWTCTE